MPKSSFHLWHVPKAPFYHPLLLPPPSPLPPLHAFLPPPGPKEGYNDEPDDSSRPNRGPSADPGGRQRGGALPPGAAAAAASALRPYSLPQREQQQPQRLPQPLQQQSQQQRGPSAAPLYAGPSASGRAPTGVYVCVRADVRVYVWAELLCGWVV